MPTRVIAVSGTNAAMAAAALGQHGPNRAWPAKQKKRRPLLLRPTPGGGATKWRRRSEGGDPAAVKLPSSSRGPRAVRLDRSVQRTGGTRNPPRAGDSSDHASSVVIRTKRAAQQAASHISQFSLGAREGVRVQHRLSVRACLRRLDNGGASREAAFFYRPPYSPEEQRHRSRGAGWQDGSGATAACAAASDRVKRAEPGRFQKE